MTLSIYLCSNQLKMKKETDEIDVSILKLMQEDSTRSNKQIAAMVNKSEATVSNRIKWLADNRYILKTVALLNADKLGNKTCGRMHLKFNEHSGSGLKTFVSNLHAISGVSNCHLISGLANVIVTISTTDPASFAEIVSKIAAIPGVVHYDLTYMLLEPLIPERGFDFDAGT